MSRVHFVFLVFPFFRPRSPSVLPRPLGCYLLPQSRLVPTYPAFTAKTCKDCRPNICRSSGLSPKRWSCLKSGPARPRWLKTGPAIPKIRPSQQSSGRVWLTPEQMELRNASLCAVTGNYRISYCVDAQVICPPCLLSHIMQWCRLQSHWAEKIRWQQYVPCQGQRQLTIYSECPYFHPNCFISSGVVAEHVNIVKTRHKYHAAFASDFRIRAHSSAPELSPVLKTSTSRSTGRDIHLPASPCTAAAISKNSSQWAALNAKISKCVDPLPLTTTFLT